jgi:NAD(P)-dependent dehydrogenase (short-subunit alcohol dehydrogenase family)
MSDEQSYPKVAIITGSDSGIGEACAVALAEAGYDVGITWHSDRDGAEETAAKVRQRGVKAAVTHLDLTQLPDAADVVDELAQELGGVGVLINNAGTGTAIPALELDFQKWRDVLAVDLDGPFLCTQRAVRRMVDAGGGGRIINVTSVHEHAPRVGSAPYCAAKAGLGLLTQVLALELSQYGITANAIAPGEIATPMTDQEDIDPRGVARPGVPLGRPGDAREVAAVAAFLASPAASYITGTSVVVDGGMLLMGPHAGSHLTSAEWRQS